MTSNQKVITQMTIKFEYFEKDSFLLATIPDHSIDLQRAQSIIRSINEECKKLNCSKVLLNELSLKNRKIDNHELRELCELMPNVRMAFLSQPELIDKKARLFSALSFSDEYIARHFSIKADAVMWLKSPLMT